MRVLIVYYTKTGHTLEAAEAVAKGIRSAGSEAEIVPVRDYKSEMLADYDAVIFGSPCWGGAFSTQDCTCSSIDKILKGLEPNQIKGKRCGAVSVHAGRGGDNTINAMGMILVDKGCVDFRPGPAAKAGVVLSLWKGPSVAPEALDRFHSFGAAFVK